jgi:glutamyl-tRNA reductase
LNTHILLLGLNHVTAPVELRERLAMNGACLVDALAQLRQSNGHGPARVMESIILSTCNRLELYAISPDISQGYQSLIEFLCLNRQLVAEELDGSLYRKVDAGAVQHIMCVACGLDSMIVGEPQVLGQVTGAYQAALAQRTAGPVLNALFQHAIRAGKRTHTETGIGRHAVSVPSVAATLAERAMGSLEGRVVLVMGAGEMGELAARTLTSRGATGIIVTNRTYERALMLARQLGGEAMPFEHKTEALVRADVVITTTGAPHFVLTRDTVAAAMGCRPDRPLVIVDIAMPRDTDPAVARVPGVRLFDIDNLKNVANGNLEARQQEMPQVEAIAAAETREFMCWFDTLGVIPTIADLHGWAEMVKADELEKALRRLGNLNEREREVVRALAHGLMGKFLHEPTVRLKEHAVEGDGHQYAGAVRELFGLEVQSCSAPQETGA